MFAVAGLDVHPKYVVTFVGYIRCTFTDDHQPNIYVMRDFCGCMGEASHKMQFSLRLIITRDKTHVQGSVDDSARQLIVTGIFPAGSTFKRSGNPR